MKISSNDRRHVLQTIASGVGTIMFEISNNPMIAIANDIDVSKSMNNENMIYVSEGKGFSYVFEVPNEFKNNNKPLKTHLDEVNFTKEGESSYQFGITVDPVRIQSLKQFGSPAEVAARVVSAELVRDGITDVTLVKDAIEDESTGYYAIDYISKGKRGVKHFMTRICVMNQMLYVLTAQCKEDDFIANTSREAEMLAIIQTFKVTGAAT